MTDEVVVATGTSGTPAQAGDTTLTKTTEGEGQVVKTGEVATDPAKAGEVVTEQKEIEYAFEMPEGVEVDKVRQDEFVALAKEAKLPADVAQKIVGMEAKRIQAEAEAHVALVKSWADTVLADKELGVPENQAIARKTIETFGTPELRNLLNSTGMGNHPEFVKLAYRIGKAISEDGFVRGSAPAGEQTAAKTLFPNMN